MRSSVLVPAAVEALLGHPVAALSERPAPRLSRLLVNVTVERSLWPVHVLLGADATVSDLARAAEGRRPPLPVDDGPTDAAARFELHLSKYALDALDLETKVLDLGSRKFFLCSNRGPPGGRRDQIIICFFTQQHCHILMSERVKAML